MKRIMIACVALAAFAAPAFAGATDRQRYTGEGPPFNHVHRETYRFRPSLSYTSNGAAVSWQW